MKSDESIYYTKDEYKNGTKHFVDSIGAGDTFFAGFISALINKEKIIPSLIYADVVAHLSTTQLGTIKVVDKTEADTEYKHIETTTEENVEELYISIEALLMKKNEIALLIMSLRMSLSQ